MKINFSKFSYTYNGETKPALKEIDLQINQGEFLLITGVSGCGKSTLALAMAGFIPSGYGGIVKGDLFIKGESSKNLSSLDLAGVVGLVQQDPEGQLCTFKVWEEAAFGPENLCLSPAEVKSRINNSLNNVGLEKLYQRDINSLSGGEKQRLAIASILTMQPELLILDEPTANLDPGGTKQVLEIIQKLRKEEKVTLIVIEHRVEEFLQFADRLIVMEQGRIIADGEPQATHSFYKDYFKKNDREEGKKQNTKALLKPSEKPLLEVINLEGYIEGKKILKGINFKLYAGERVAIMGNNGCGKTSLLFSLLGINKASDGQIIYKGEDITRFSVQKRAALLGMVFQNPNHQIFENTVYKEAMLAASFLAPGNFRDNINNLLERFGLLDYKEKLPFALSQGEKKRLTVVSVLAYEPNILLLDEPLAGQDNDNLNILLDVLDGYLQNEKLVMLVSHNPEFVLKHCDRLLFFENGRLLINSSPINGFQLLKERGKHEFVPLALL